MKKTQSKSEKEIKETIIDSPGYFFIIFYKAG